MQRILQLYRSSYEGLNPASWWLALVMLINRSGTMVLPFMTLYLTQTRGFRTEQAGLVMAIFGAGAICGGYLGGRLTDRFGFYNVQLVSLAGGGLLFPLLGTMTSFPAICICSFFLALINDSFRPANSIAVAAYSKPEHTTRSYSLNRLAINLGWALGGSLGGFIAAKNYELLFIIDGCTNLSAAILLRIVLKPVAGQTKKKQATQAGKFEVFKDLRYMAFIGFVLLFSLAFFQLFSTQPLYFKTVLLLTEKQIGILMALNGLLIAMLEMVLVFKLEGRRHPLRYIPVGTAMLAISFLMFVLPVTGLGIALVSTLMMTAGEMLSMPFMNTFWVSRTNDSNRGSYAGIFTIAWAIAQVFGPAGGTWIAANAGFSALWWTVGAVGCASALGFWLLGRAER